jgi:hypothetical protein
VPTLNFLNQFATNNPNYNILYIHTKGIWKGLNLCVEDQIEYMLYFNIIKWRDCLNALIEYDTCGVDLRSEPVLHYS